MLPTPTDIDTGREAVPARGTSAPRLIAAWLALALVLAPRAAVAQSRDIPLPPPPPGTKRIPLPPPPPGTSLVPRPAAPAAERCTGCHAPLTQGRVIHGALQKHECTSCHRAVTSEAGKCKSRTASKWNLVKTEPDLCYGCHARKDEQKSVHTVIRQGSCLACHAAHSSNFGGLLTTTRQKICFECHEAEPLVTKAVKHAPVLDGRCVDCHDAHGGNLPNNVKAASGAAFCLKCHDAKAPVEKGMPGPGFRVDMGKKTVHAAFKRTDCLGCHEGGHSSDNLKMLKRSVGDTCYGCHERKDKHKFPHSAVVLGDCAVCHDPHSSDQPKLIAKETIAATCFLCHQDDVTARKVVHAPVTKGCDQCHAPHGGQSRNALKGGEGKAACYKCHKPVDEGRVKHVAVERYGCTGCHDPHGTANAAMLPKKVNALCTACHAEQADGRHVTAIAAAGHPVGGGELVDPRRQGREFSCASCHNPHGSNSPKLLYYGKTPIESCDWCHGDKSGKSGLKNVIKNARRLERGSTTGVAGAGALGGGGGPAAGGGAGSPAPGGGAPVPGGGAPAPGSGDGVTSSQGGGSGEER